MKNLLLTVLAIFFIGNFVFAQTKAQEETQAKKKLFCVTVSCCSVGPIEIEVWSHTTCVSVDVQKTASGKSYNSTMSFETAKPVDELTFSEDMILAGQFDSSGNQLMLPKGTYKAENNTIYFTAKKMERSLVNAKKKTYCVTADVEGSFFGHDYSYSIEVCVTFGSSQRNGYAVVSLEPKLDKATQLKLKESGLTDFILGEDIEINGFTVNSGTYKVNPDGKIYLNLKR